MSKVSKLKQEAYQAGKKRDWDKVIVLYERILEFEKNNPALINELGDAYLKRNNVSHAIENFLAAAEQYRLTGLVNNAVAIYKKILRFDTGNISAHWFLAESRASQGLGGEGVGHALHFLAASERLGGDFKDAFLKRCVKLLALFPRQPEILARLAEVFAFWCLPLEAARVALLQACLKHEAGGGDKAEQEANALLAQFPELNACPEFAAWQSQLGGGAPGTGKATSHADHNAIELGGSDEAPAPSAAEPAPAGDAPVSASAAPQGSAAGTESSLAQSLGMVDFGAGAAGGFPLGDLGGAQPDADASGEQDAPAADDGMTRSGRSPLFDVEEPFVGDDAEEDAGDGEEGRIEITLDDAPSLEDLAHELASENEAPPPDGKPVDLLAEILAEDDADSAAADASQLDTIVSEIGQQVGGAQAQDPGSQYDMGLVYLEMELFAQAEECFETASASGPHALRSYEMWGITLVRQGRYEDAIDVLGRGLRVPGAAPSDLLGLLYHTGEAYQLAGRSGAAREYYERVYQIAPTFLDIDKRLETLESV